MLQGRSPGDEDADTVEEHEIPGEPGLGQSVVDIRDPEKDRHPLEQRLFEDVAERPQGGDDHDPRPHIERQDHPDGEGKGVEHGQKDDGPVPGGDIEKPGTGLGIGEDVLVAEHGPFGLAGGPGGVEENRQIVQGPHDGFTGEARFQGLLEGRVGLVGQSQPTFPDRMAHEPARLGVVDHLFMDGRSDQH